MVLVPAWRRPTPRSQDRQKADADIGRKRMVRRAWTRKTPRTSTIQQAGSIMATVSQYSTSVAPLIGRVLIAAIFLVSGLGKLATPGATQDYIASIGLPAPALALVVAIIVELGAGALLLLGYRVREAAPVLAAYSVLTALLFHNAISDPNQLFHLLKNFAIAGGLLMTFEFGAGAFSLDARRAAASPGMAQADLAR
jgi:putative oxidoreductase